MAKLSRKDSGRAVLLMDNTMENWSTAKLCSNWKEGARWARRSWRGWLLKVHGYKDPRTVDLLSGLSDAEFLEKVGGEVDYDYFAEEDRLYIFVQPEPGFGVGYTMTLAPGSQFRL